MKLERNKKPCFSRDVSNIQGDIDIYEVTELTDVRELIYSSNRERKEGDNNNNKEIGLK